MNGTQDFQIENGVLVKYTGPGGDVVIPEGVTGIGEMAFNNCRGLTSITLPAGVTSIGSFAFFSCSNLTSVTLLDGVTSIGDSAFWGCSSLTSITLPSSVTSIGREAFCNCSSLTNVTIPDGVTSIGNSAFFHCSSLTNVTIPHGVTSIGRSAFEGCSSLTGITLPASVTNIGEETFEGCSNLKQLHCDSLESWLRMDQSGWNDSPLWHGADLYLAGEIAREVVIPEGVTSIGKKAFKGCSSLTSVTIPDGVTSIGDCAFWGCSSLTSITLPDGVTSIGESAFFACHSLTDITISDSVTSIGDWAFCNCSATDITIPDSVTSIGDRAFYCCCSIMSITIPGSVMSIGKKAFPEFAWGSSYTVVVRGRPGDALRKYLSKNAVFRRYMDYSGWLCSEVPVSMRKNVAMGVAEAIMEGEPVPDEICQSYLKYIIGHKKEWFAEPSGENRPVIQLLMREKEIDITEIDALVERVSRLQDPDLLNQLMAYQTENFHLEDYDRQTEKDFRQMERDAKLRSDPTTQKYINAMWAVSRKMPYVTSYKDDREVVTFPTQVGKTKVTGIADGFRFKENADKIREIVIPEGYTYIGAGAFQGCSGLTSVAIPPSVTSIWNHAFQGCSSLTSVAIPEGVTKIWDETFSGCGSLTDITIPSGVTSIGNGAFRDCGGLTSVVIPEGVTEIDWNAFRDCGSLTSVTIPDSVTSVGTYAFSGCDRLREIRCKNEELAWAAKNGFAWPGNG